jgi:hypothetical protein
VLTVATVVTERNEVIQREQLDQAPKVMVGKHRGNLSGPAHRRKLVRPGRPCLGNGGSHLLRYRASMPSGWLARKCRLDIG